MSPSQSWLKRTTTILIALLCLLGCATAGWCEPPRESLEAIRLRYERQRRELSEKLRVQKVELMKLMALDNPSSEHIKKKLNQILETEEERQHLFVDEMFAVRGAMSESEWRDYRRSVIFMMMDKKTR